LAQGPAGTPEDERQSPPPLGATTGQEGRSDAPAARPSAGGSDTGAWNDRKPRTAHRDADPRDRDV